MGWLYTHKDSDISVKEFFESRFNYQKEDGRYGKVLDCAVVRLRTAYMAYEIGHTDGTKEVIGIVCLLDYSPKDYYNFGYKDMDETMGPYQYDCPERILKLLTPTENENAREWREICWERIKSRQKRPKLVKGMVIEFTEPITFRGGQQERFFRVVDPRRLLFINPHGQWFKLRRRILQNKEWKIRDAG